MHSDLGHHPRPRDYRPSRTCKEWEGILPFYCGTEEGRHPLCKKQQSLNTAPPPYTHTQPLELFRTQLNI